MKISITGANGFIGQRLLEVLTRQGHDICVLSRTCTLSFSTEIQVVKGDLTSPNCPFDKLLDDCEVVFHCAGEIRDATVMKSLHVDGTKRLLQAVLNEAAKKRREIHWVQLSSVGAYGPPREAPAAERIVTEDTPTCPIGVYETTKTLSDELVIQSSSRGVMTYSIVRPSNVIGARMSNRSLHALGMMVRKGLFFYIGRPGAVAPYVHVDDVAEVLGICAVDHRAKGKIFNVSNDCLLEEMIGGMASTLGVRAPWLRLPEAFVRIVARAGAMVAPIPLTQDRIGALVARTRYPYLKLEKELGFAPRVSVPGVIGKVLAT